ncbi:hypothetical protein PC116_g26544 [Phytophthora cactorum]|nr:hypothetical protein PC116_g26544 [Phytophthora cactorum]
MSVLTPHFVLTTVRPRTARTSRAPSSQPSVRALPRRPLPLLHVLIHVIVHVRHSLLRIGLHLRPNVEVRKRPLCRRRHERMVVDLATSPESDPESSGSTRTLLPGRPSSPGDTTSGASNKLDSAGSVSLSSLVALIARQGDERQEDHTFLARLMAYGLTRPNKPSNPTQRQALLNASSATELLVVLPGPYTAPDYSQSLAELKADLYTAQSENASLTRWLDTLAIENADLGTRMKVAEKQVADLEADAKHSANHVASLCKVIALSETKLAKLSR